MNNIFDSFLSKTRDIVQRFTNVQNAILIQRSAKKILKIKKMDKHGF